MFPLIFVDVDECQSPGACASGHLCNNTIGSFTCQCPLGFVDVASAQNPLSPVCFGEKVIPFSFIS